MVGNGCNCKNQGLSMVGDLGDICSKYIYVANNNSNSIAVVDSDAQKVVKDIGLRYRPIALAVNPIVNAVYVVNQEGNSITVIDSTINEIVGSIKLGIVPNSITVDIVRNIVYVVNYGSHTVSLIDGYTNRIIAVLGTGARPDKIAINPLIDRVYISNLGDSTITVIDTRNKSVVTRIELPDIPRKIAVDCVNNLLYVIGRDSGLTILIDCNTNSILPFVWRLNAPMGMAVNQNTGRVYISDLTYWLRTKPSSVEVIDGNGLRESLNPWHWWHNSRSIYLEHGRNEEGYLLYASYELSIDARKNLIYVTVPADDKIFVIDGETEQVIGSIEGLHGPVAIAQCILGS
ncbi:MAG: YncE family protein [Clostridioides sp.]|jgi:YVTN family beta-propeller protein|nr:YncE family protein [Clostridioides sp.]